MAVNIKDLRVMGLDASTTSEAVKVRWLELAEMHHPDKGGDAAKFDEVRKAKDRLLDELAKPVRCRDCRGEGKVTRAKGFASIKLKCATCRGSGTVPRE